MPIPAPERDKRDNRVDNDAVRYSCEAPAVVQEERLWSNVPKQLGLLAAPQRDALTEPANDLDLVACSATPDAPLSWSDRCRRFIYTAKTSNNTYSMIGNVIIAAHLPVGIYVQIICAGLAIWNEMREREASQSIAEKEQAPSWCNTAKRVLWSPGIYRYSLAAAFMANALEQLASHSPGLSAAFLLLGAGNLCVGHDLNRGYFGRHGIGYSLLRSSSEQGPVIRTAWALLTSGAVYWGIADMLVGLEGLRRRGLHLLIAPPLFGVAVACAAVSVVSVLVLARRAPGSPIPYALNALTNYVFAVANVAYVPGSQAIAAAISLWGTGSVFLALGKCKSQSKEEVI
jgi:hypothetical protein